MEKRMKHENNTRRLTKRFGGGERREKYTWKKFSFIWTAVWCRRDLKSMPSMSRQNQFELTARELNWKINAILGVDGEVSASANSI